MTDINIAKSNIETAGFVDIDIDVNLDIFAEIERLKKEKDQRPLIKKLSDGELLNFLSNKYHERQMFYSQAKYHLTKDKINEFTFTEIIAQHE